VCAVGGCQPGFVDLDGDPQTGCEASCRPTNPPDEVCDGLDNDCDGGVDGPESCAGDAFGFCRGRQALAPPWFCHDFAAGSLDADWWDFSIGRVGAVPGLIAGRAYTGGVPAGPGSGGGHTVRVKVFGPTLRLGFHGQWRGTPIGAGVFLNTLRPNDDPALTGTGFTVEMIDDAGDPALRVVEHPAGVERARAPAPGLSDALIHFVQATRDAAGHWRLSVDGAPLGLDVDAPDATQSKFNRVTVFADAAVGGSTLDNLVIEVDADGDARYPPADDCPDVPNGETSDADGNGRGVHCDDRDGDTVEDALDPCPAVAVPPGADADADGVDDACDGDGQALVMSLGAGANRSPYLMRLEDGVRWRAFQASGPMDHFDVGLDGRFTYTGDRSIGVAGADGAAPTPIVLQAERPAWLADGRLLYHGGDGHVYVVGADGQNPVQLLAQGPGERLRVRVVRGGTVLLVVRGLGNDATLEIRTVAGQVMMPPTFIPGTGGAPPWVDLHPTALRLVVAGTAGDAVGVSLVDAARQLVTPLRDTPTSAVVFSPKGDVLLALEQLPAGRRVVAFGPTPGATVAELAPPSPEVGDTLAWGPADRVPEALDADRDGLHDATDACPEYPWEPVPPVSAWLTCHGNEGSFGDVRATWDGTDWMLGVAGLCSIEHMHIIRINARGEYDRSYYIGNQTDYGHRRAPSVVWNGRGHTIAYGTIVGQYFAMLGDNLLNAGGSLELNAFRVDDCQFAPGLARRGAHVLGAGLIYRARVFDRSLGVLAAAERLNGAAPRLADAVPHPGGALLIGSDPGINAQLVDDNLGPAGAASNISAASNVHRFDVKAVADGYIVAWTDANHQMAARHLNANGVPDGAPVRISLGFEPAGRPSITSVGDTVLLAWPQQTPGNDRVYMRAFTLGLAPKGEAFAVGADLQEIHAVSIAADDAGRVGVVWMGERPGFNPRNPNYLSIGRFQCRQP
jgi:hypothetical protein